MYRNNKYVYAAIFIILIGLFLSYTSYKQFYNNQISWQNYANRVALVDNTINSLYSNMGYGGFIHDFKNLVLRGDLDKYEKKINRDIVSIQTTLNNLDDLTETAKEKQAAKDIRDTFEKYTENYYVAKEKVIAGLNSADIDKAIIVDDTMAVKAIAYLHNTFNERLLVARNEANVTYTQAVTFFILSILLYILLITIAIVLLSRNERKIFGITQSELVAKEFADSILYNSPDPMLIVEEDGSISRSNNIAEQFFGYTNEELNDMKVEQLIPESFRKKHTAYRRQAYENPRNRAMGSGQPLLALTRAGKSIQVEISLSVQSIGNKKYAIIVLRDITERERINQELIKARDDAESAAKAKSLFISSMSHEVRTPLNIVIGYSQLFVDAATTSHEEMNEYGKEIFKAGSHLLELVNEILDLASIEDGNTEQNLKAVNIIPIIMSSINISENLAKENAVTMSFLNSEQKGVYVIADKVRFNQIMLNLLSNAIKYNNKNGSVSISVSKNEIDNVVIEISDTGKGLLEEDIDRLFEPFDRLGAERSSILGTGIGLTITKQLIENINGEIHVQSTEGVGTTFSISLPCISEPSEISVDEIEVI